MPSSGFPAPGTAPTAPPGGSVNAPSGPIGDGSQVPAPAGMAGPPVGMPGPIPTAGAPGVGNDGAPSPVPTQPPDSGAMPAAMSPMGPGNPCPGAPPPGIKLTQIVEGLVGPTHVAQAPGDPSRLYVTEQRGTLRVVENGQLSADFVIDLRSAAVGAVNATEIAPNTYGEGGLLALVFDPEFETSKRLWLSYTTPGPGYSLAEFRMEQPGRIDPTSYKEVLNFRQYGFYPGSQGTNHVGSMVAFGPDGYLYLSRGDGGGEYDRQMSGQDTSDDLCSILRIDPDTYPTPVEGNFAGHVWSYGFRNPWRFSFDRFNGDMYIGDVGQDAGSGFEEINVEPAGVPGRNYGWRAVDVLGEPAQGPCSGDCGGTTAPALAYPITATENSVIGGYVYRGSAIGGMQGRYLWADWTERRIKTFVYAGDENGRAKICDEYDTGVTVPLKVRSFGEGLDGELYLLAGGSGTPQVVGNVDLGGAAVNVPGALYRIDSDGSAPPATASGGMTGGGAMMPAAGPVALTGQPTFSAIYREILTNGMTGNCMAGFCHGAEPSASNGNLKIVAGDPGGTYQTLVSVASSSAMCSGRSLVVPSDAAASLLVQKLGPNPPCGARMPQGGMLTQAQIDQISAWIDRGAPND